MNCDKSGRMQAGSIQWLMGLTLALLLCTQLASAQASSETKTAELKPASDIYQTFYLNNISDQRDASDILTDLRNLLPKTRSYLVPAPSAISVRGPAEDIEQARKMLADLDRVRKVYRLTYTITETDNGKRIAVQHYTLIAISGEKSEFKQGSRIPVVTGTTEPAGSTTPASQVPASQVQYIDVGLNLAASLDGNQGGLRLHSKVEQSNLSEEKSGMGAQDPVVHQTMLETMSILVPGKPIVLGSLDVPGSTRHQEIEVVSELVR